jgi:hypothetical protein
MVILLLAASLGGCGKTAGTASSTTGKAANTKHAAPAYRAGQYCLNTRGLSYIAAGLTCKSRHLVRR